MAGYTIPLLGLGAGANDDCVPACLAALKHGYRCVPRETIVCGTANIQMDSSASSSSFRRLIDTARYYGNEDQVGRAVRESGMPRGDIFVSKCRIRRLTARIYSP